MAMTLSEISSGAGGAGGEKFTFKRVGDAVKGVITRIPPLYIDAKGKKALILEIDVTNARGGIISRFTDEDGLEQIKVADFAAGDSCTVWMNQGFGMGAVRDAIAEAGATEIREGGTITIKLTEKRDVGKESPANIFAVTYEPPVGGTSVDDLDDSF